jgi:hypothetical protein
LGGEDHRESAIKNSMNHQHNKGLVVRVLDAGVKIGVAIWVIGWMLSTRVGGFLLFFVLGCVGALFPVCGIADLVLGDDSYYRMFDNGEDFWLYVICGLVGLVAALASLPRTKGLPWALVD